MFRKIFVFFIFIQFFLLAPALAENDREDYFRAKDDYIGNLEIKAQVNLDSSLSVREDQEWIFINEGSPLEIKRQWPLSFEDRRLEIEDFSIVEVNGYTGEAKKIDFKFEKNKDSYKLAMSTEPRKKSEAQKYVITYKVRGGIVKENKQNNRFRYWLWGNGFAHQVHNARLEVKLPQEVDYQPLRVDCRSGLAGAGRLCQDGIHLSGAEKKAQKLVFREFNLDAGEGVLVDFRLPRELADRYRFFIIVINKLKSPWFIWPFLAVLLTSVAFALFIKKKK